MECTFSLSLSNGLYGYIVSAKQPNSKLIGLESEHQLYSIYACKHSSNPLVSDCKFQNFIRVGTSQSARPLLFPYDIHNSKNGEDEFGIGPKRVNAFRLCLV